MGSVGVSATLIVRNEAPFLRGCLDSLAGKVDEIVIVDTGSTDGTQEIAASSGARLFHFGWIDDFAAARNRALDAATGAWILYIDADERLDSPVSLSQIVSRADHIGFMMKFQPKIGYSAYREMRLFKADPRIRFEGRIHERVLPSIEQMCASEGLLIGQTDATIRHLGYENDQTRKHARNLPLLTRAVEDDPERVYLWWHLGETLAEIGAKEKAIDAFRHGIDVARTTGTPRGRIEAAMAAQSLTRLYLEAGCAANALDVVDDALGLRPKDPALLLLKGRTLIELGRLEDALALLSSLPLEHPEAFFDPDMAYDLRIFSEWPHALAGLAAFRLGLFHSAAASYRAAAAVAPGEEQYRVKAAFAAARAVRPTVEFDV